MVSRKARRLGLPTEMTAIEQSQANGRAEQRVRALRERLQIMDEDARRLSAEIILDHPAAQWAVRQAEWIQNFLVKSDVDLSGGGRIKITPHDAHTGNSTEQCCWNPDFWLVGRLVTKMQTSFFFETDGMKKSRQFKKGKNKRKQ